MFSASAVGVEALLEQVKHGTQDWQNGPKQKDKDVSHGSLVDLCVAGVWNPEDSSTVGRPPL